MYVLPSVLFILSRSTLLALSWLTALLGTSKVGTYLLVQSTPTYLPYLIV